MGVSFSKGRNCPNKCYGLVDYGFDFKGHRQIKLVFIGFMNVGHLQRRVAVWRCPKCGWTRCL